MNTPRDGWLAEPVGLRPGVELLGADRRMLYVPGSGRYLRLTPAAVRVLPHLDGRVTGRELVDRVTARSGRHGPRAGAEAGYAVARLLDELRRAGALTGTDGPAPATIRWHRRIPLTRSVSWLTRGPAAVLRRIPARVAAVLVVLGTVPALALVAAALVRGGGLAGAGRVPLVVLLVALPVQVVLHESAHAVLCEALGVPAREVGVVVWAYVLPVPYVDCTDAYRLPGRWSRAAIVLAGPVVDVLALGGSAGAWLLTGAPAAYGLLLVQLAILVTTVNPALPGDGHHAVVALTGDPRPRRHRGYAVVAVLWFLGSVALVAATAWTLVAGADR